MTERTLVAVMIGLVRIYQWVLSPLFPGSCRYSPTCSAYAVEAMTRHGPFRGAWMTLRRLGRCHPLGGSGWDPVPERPAAEPAATGPAARSLDPRDRGR